ncbi:MAG: flagellar FlbD family protein [Solirubrobacteraceae bacterium]
MIVLHRLGHQAEPFYLSPEMIVTVEANPDTVVTLTTGAKVIVHESPEVVVKRIRRARAEVLADAAQLRDGDRELIRENNTLAWREGADVLRVFEKLAPVAEAS